MPYMKEEKDGKWCVYKKGEDGKPEGKALGEHDSEAEADKQIAAIYANENAGKSTQPQTFLKFVQLTKVDAVKGEVWGTLSSETPDKAGEIIDYEHSKAHFVKWSDAMQKASNGKSKGNLRAMHNGQVGAAGKLIHFEARDDTKDFYIGAKVIDPVDLQKVLEGVYTGFSVGGGYGPWMKKDGAYLRREGIPVEASLVDNPCNPDSTFQFVKADGQVEMRKFATVQKGDAMADNFPTLAKASLQDRIDGIRSAYYAKFQEQGKPMESSSGWVTDILDDGVIVQKDGGLFKFPYTLGADGAVTFGEPVKVERAYSVLNAEVNKSDNPDELHKADEPAAGAEEDKGGAADEPEPADGGEAAGPMSRDEMRVFILGILEELGLVVKEGTAMKAVQSTDMQKSAEALDLVKADFAKQHDELSKAISDGTKALAGDIAQLVLANEDLTKRIEPLTGMGPVIMVPGGSNTADMMKAQEIEVLKKYQSSAKTPEEAARFGELIAAAEIHQVHQTKKE